MNNNNNKENNNQNPESYIYLLLTIISITSYLLSINYFKNSKKISKNNKMLLLLVSLYSFIYNYQKQTQNKNINEQKRLEKLTFASALVVISSYIYYKDIEDEEILF